MKLCIGALVAAVALAACGGSEPEPTPTPEPTATATSTPTEVPTATNTPAPTATPTPVTKTVAGIFELVDDFSHLAPAAECEGDGGYSDVQEGFQVRLIGDGGDILDVDRFEQGKVIDGNCWWFFELQVPEGHRFYTVETRRGEFTYSYDEITTRGVVTFSLGR